MGNLQPHKYINPKLVPELNKTHEKMRIINDIVPRREDSMIVSEISFPEGLRILKEKGYELISLKETAHLMLKRLKIKGIQNWVREGIIYIPEKGRFITKNSPILENPRVVAEKHSNGEVYPLSNPQIEEALKNSIEIRGNPKWGFKKNRKKYSCPIDKLRNNNVAKFCFEEYVSKLEEPLFLIEDLNIFLKTQEEIDRIGVPFAEQLYLKYWNEAGNIHFNIFGNPIGNNRLNIRGIKYWDLTNPHNKQQNGKSTRT